MKINNKKDFIIYDSRINEQNRQNISINNDMEEKVVSNQQKKFCNLNLMIK